MDQKNFARITGVIDCACVIHGNGYSWDYVDRLYNMLMRVFNSGIRFHVYTEPSREVPSHMIKHALTLWEDTAPRKSWWYKMQLFNPEHHQGNMLYLDLDVVVARELDWIRDLDTKLLWAIRDFRYLQRDNNHLLNSSVMWWNVPAFADVWYKFQKENFSNVFNRWPGDQDYITDAVPMSRRRFFEDRYFESYRWQCIDGGYDFRRRIHRAPGTGVSIQPDTSVVVFHGTPKPHQVHDPVITDLWR